MINRNTIDELIRKSAPHNLTITLPTYTKGEEVQQNPIRFKNLLSKAEEQLLAGGFRRNQIGGWLQKAEDLLDDLTYWNHMDHGLAFYINDSQFRSFKLPYGLSERVYFNDHFLITPLFPMVSLNGSWHLLAISQKHLRLLRCTRESVEDVTPDDIFTSIDQFIDEKPEVQIQFHTGAAGKDAMYFGHGGSEEDKKVLVRKYFHGVEESITRVVRQSGDPLLIAGTEEIVSLYRSLNKYDRLMDRTVGGYPGEMKERELQQSSWELIRDYFLKDMYRAIDRFGSEQRQAVSSSLSEVVESTVMGKTDTLFIAMDEVRWGRYDMDSHAVLLENGQAEPGASDLLNWTALKAMEQGAKVYALPRREMPDQAEMAALFRF